MLAGCIVGGQLSRTVTFPGQNYGDRITVHLIAGVIQVRRKRSGHFWQGRFGAVAMDEEHLATALRYVSLNPVRSRLVERAQDWRWSGTRAHLRGKDDGLTALAPIKDRFPHLSKELRWLAIAGRGR